MNVASLAPRALERRAVHPSRRSGDSYEGQHNKPLEPTAPTARRLSGMAFGGWPALLLSPPFRMCYVPTVRTVGLLTHKEILVLRGAAISAGLADSRAALLAGVDTRLIAGLVKSTTPGEQLLCDLAELNTARTPPTDAHPLAIWLANAEALSRPKPQADAFGAARARIEAWQTGTEAGARVEVDAAPPVVAEILRVTESPENDGSREIVLLLSNCGAQPAVVTELGGEVLESGPHAEPVTVVTRHLLQPYEAFLVLSPASEYVQARHGIHRLAPTESDLVVIKTTSSVEGWRYVIRIRADWRIPGVAMFSARSEPVALTFPLRTTEAMLNHLLEDA